MAIYDGIGTRWRESGPVAKAALAAGVVLIVVFLAAGIVWISRDSYQVLFADLDPQDAATIVAELDKMKIPYRLRDEGRTILVDQDTVYKTRLKVMGNNGVLLRGTVGFEIFNTTDFGMTEFAQKINYQRALQGELARTISSFDEVKSARVHLVLPESSLFKKSQAKPKASVTLVTTTGGRLRAEQISGIQRLVAAAVPEIEPAAVTVVDQRGVALTRNPEESEPAAVSGRLEIKKEMEGYFVRKIADVLDKTFGPGQSIVSVDITLNHDHAKVTREDVIPYGNRSGDALGVVTRRRQSVQGGPASKEPPGRQQSDFYARESSREAASSSMVQTEYQSGRVIEQIVSTPGAIRRMSVGVLVPSESDPARIAKAREMVAMTVGLTPSRGDAIAVYSLDQLVKVGNAPTAGGAAPSLAYSAAISRPAGTNPPANAGNGTGLSLSTPALLLSACGALVVLLAVSLIRRNRRGGKLSSTEREHSLEQIKQWLASGDGVARDGRTT